MFTTGAVYSVDHLARFVWHQDQTITADPTGLQRSLEHRTLGLGCHGGSGRTKQLFQSHILGRMHQTGVRSGVRQSETKRTGT